MIARLLIIFALIIGHYTPILANYLKIYSKKGQHPYAEWKGKRYRCQVGKNGIVPGETRIENTRTTPAGEYAIVMLMYRPDRLKLQPRDFPLPLQPITKTSRWCKEYRHKFYNWYIDSRDYPKVKSSPLYIDQDWFDIVAVIDYNTHNGKVGSRAIERPEAKRGDGIFLHVRKKDFEPSLGCVGFEKQDLIAILKDFTKEDRVVIHLGD